jgi:hypothetical protein
MEEDMSIDDIQTVPDVHPNSAEGRHIETEVVSRICTNFGKNDLLWKVHLFSRLRKTVVWEKNSPFFHFADGCPCRCDEHHSHIYSILLMVNLSFVKTMAKYLLRP